MANKYIRIYEELGTTDSRVFDSVSINKLYTLASAPEEVKEDVANSKNKENPNIIKAKEFCHKKVICLNDNKIFDSLTEASNYYKISKTSISDVCKGKYKHTHNLYFRYYEDYLKQIA